eukprot:2483572-Prymnesium_polylepis.3
MSLLRDAVATRPTGIGDTNAEAPWSAATKQSTTRRASMAALRDEGQSSEAEVRRGERNVGKSGLVDHVGAVHKGDVEKSPRDHQNAPRLGA